MPRIRLEAARALSDRVTHFVFAAPFAHAAGQYVALSAAIDGTPVKRYYSIASPPRGDGRIELCVQTEGAFGSHLEGLPSGTELECSEPAGRMRLLDAERPTVYFAAGTGVAPLRAMLLSQLAAAPRAAATLVLGGRRREDLLYRDEFEALRGRHAGFTLLATVSGDDPDWDGLRGRVTAHFDQAIAGRDGLDAYFCGPPEMVSALRARAGAAGIPDERQGFERY